jgi:hypothetical protein
LVARERQDKEEVTSKLQRIRTRMERIESSERAHAKEDKKKHAAQFYDW